MERLQRVQKLPCTLGKTVKFQLIYIHTRNHKASQMNEIVTIILNQTSLLPDFWNFVVWIFGFALVAQRPAQNCSQSYVLLLYLASRAVR
jgi:hypothetical protein